MMLNGFVWRLLLLVIVIYNCHGHEDRPWFEAEIVRDPQWTYAVLHPNETLEARCTAKGFPLPAVYFINEYIDFDFDYDDVIYTYGQVNETFAYTMMVIVDPVYASYMPQVFCETENGIGFHDNIFMGVTRL